MTRKELFDAIEKYHLSYKVKQVTGKNYINCSSIVLEEIVTASVKNTPYSTDLVFISPSYKEKLKEAPKEEIKKEKVIKVKEITKEDIDQKLINADKLLKDISIVSNDIENLEKCLDDFYKKPNKSFGFSFNYPLKRKDRRFYLKKETSGWSSSYNYNNENIDYIFDFNSEEVFLFNQLIKEEIDSLKTKLSKLNNSFAAL